MYIIHLLIRNSTVAQCNGNLEAIMSDTNPVDYVLLPSVVSENGT